MKEKAWAGVDVGKGFRWAYVVDASGTELLSRRVDNDEADLLALIGEALAFAGDVAWAVDRPGGGAALLLALLRERGQRVIYVPGLATAGGPLAAGVLRDASGDYAFLPPATVALLLLAIPTVLAAEYGYRSEV